MDNSKDKLITCSQLYREEETFTFYGEFEERSIIGKYNRSKVNPKEPDLRLYYRDAPPGTKEFLALWLKESPITGRRYLIGNADGMQYVGFINDNRLDDNEPYLTLCYVLKF